MAVEAGVHVRKTIRAVPGPRGHWFWGSFPEYRLDPTGFIHTTWQTYGDICRFRLTPTTHTYVVVHPDALEHVLQTNFENYHRFPYRSPLFGKSVASSDGLEWRRQRELIQPLYNRNRIVAMAPKIVASAERFAAQRSQQSGVMVDAGQELTTLVLRNTCLALFGKDLAEPQYAIDRHMRVCIGYMSSRMHAMPFTGIWPWSTLRQAHLQARRNLLAILQTEIDERTRSGSLPDDVLSGLIAKFQAEGYGTSVIADNALALIAASYITTTETLVAACRQLSESPELQEEIHEEVAGLLQGRSVSLDDLPRLPLLRAFHAETLRFFSLFNPVFKSREADTVMGHRIPARSCVLLATSATHRHPGFWEEPNRFDPKRFLDNRLPAHRYAYLPFGAGPRVCVGKAYALCESPLLLATILQRCRVTNPNPAQATRLAFCSR